MVNDLARSQTLLIHINSDLDGISNGTEIKAIFFIPYLLHTHTHSAWLQPLLPSLQPLATCCKQMKPTNWVAVEASRRRSDSLSRSLEPFATTIRITISEKVIILRDINESRSELAGETTDVVTV